VKTFLGIDGGGTKTDFLLIDETGHVRASYKGGSAYYLETGLDALQSMLATGIQATLKQGGVAASDLGFAFIGLPAHGEDSGLLPRLNNIAADVLAPSKFRCGNDMVCGWAGALGGSDGINIVAGTGSIAYGEFVSRQARAGGWGELFSDEGSAYWIAREALTLFSRMSDGRETRGPLYHLIKDRFQLAADLDLCAVVYGPPPLSRSKLAALAPLVAEATREGDVSARGLFEQATGHLAAIIHAVYDQLHIPDGTTIPVSYSGGMFKLTDFVTPMLEVALRRGERRYRFVAPRLPPVAGAALYAAKLARCPANAAGIQRLETHFVVKDPA
jgi:N-acetylglucosamine kinase-like BadF-type ATPase